VNQAKRAKLPPENYGKMKEKQLQEACKQRALDTKGKKPVLVDRLQKYDKS
jgi:hypothetical protein